jgi:hypothetical protein
MHAYEKQESKEKTYLTEASYRTRRLRLLLDVKSTSASWEEGFLFLLGLFAGVSISCLTGGSVSASFSFFGET